MRLTSILALCVAAAPVLAEQKYLHVMGTMDFAQTTTGGEYDVDTSTPSGTIYWEGANEVAFLTNQSQVDSKIFQSDLNYSDIRSISLNDIKSTVYSTKFPVFSRINTGALQD